ncbi:MAG TPA: sigma-70 family RNA polymerase sigma factor [Planctomycetota bacterium]|nr:sigma-70 family RNA polymerase sigma factor [Planctomycetota bacterium]
MSEELEARLRQGDEQALAALFTQHRPHLFKIISFRLDPRLAQRVDPEDILQEAFLAAQTRLVHFVKDPMASSFLWLRLITLQTLQDVYRRHASAKQRDFNRDVAMDAFSGNDQTSVALVNRLAVRGPSPASIAARRDLISRIGEFISQLEPIDREVIALRHYEELSNSETARVLGIQEKAASIRYMRALKRLKDLMAQLDSLGDS